MNYPLISEYVEAIKAAEDNFEQLNHLRPVLGEDGEPVMTSGNFAVVFKMKDEQTGKLHAVKCFLKEQEGRAEAYRQIAEELEYVNSTFLTPIKYLDKELFVDSSNSEDSEFPVLLMDWVEGQTLDKYIQNHVARYLIVKNLDDVSESFEKGMELNDEEYVLRNLAYQFSLLAIWLLQKPFAHGDIKPDNILVHSDGSLVLVDYDGMYVPAMKGLKARELGSPNFRHPSRTEDDFDEHIDDFPLSSIFLSLLATANEPALLENYGEDGRLLFSETDYYNLTESQVFDALKPQMHNKEIMTSMSLLCLCYAQKALFKESYVLFRLSEPEIPYTSLIETTNVDIINSWTDEYGVVYSLDGKRLIRIPDEIIEYRIKPETQIICNTVLGEVDTYGVRKCNLKSIYLPASIKAISFGAFTGCQKLCMINVDENNPAYDSRNHCNAIIETKYNRLIIGCQTTVIPKGVSVIAIGAFVSCKNLKSVLIPNSVTTIGESAFMNCERVKSLLIPSSVKEIGKRAFNGSGIESVVVDKYNTIYDSRDNCNAIILTKENKIVFGCDNTIIPSTVRAIGNSAFECCEIRELKIPNDVDSIDAFAFSHCKKLMAIIFPYNLKIIGVSAFNGCSELTTLIFQNSVKEIGFFAFSGCSSIESIYIPYGTKTKFEALKLGDDFTNKLVEQVEAYDILTKVSYEDWLASEEDSVGASYSIDGRRILGFGFYDYSLEIYDIKPGTQVICDLAFNNYENDNHFLRGVHIPSSVIAIGKGVFAGCTNGFEIICDSPFFKVEDGLLYDKTYTRLIACIGSSKSSVYIDQRVEIIGAYCFSYCEIQRLVVSQFIRKVEEHSLDTIKQIFIPSEMKTKYEVIFSDYKEKLVVQDKD